jgi:transcriptional regulator
LYVPEKNVEDRIRLAGLTPARAIKYSNTLKMLELADKGLRTADIAQEMNIAYKDVQVLRRSAASTIKFVEDKINVRLTE